MGIVTENPQLSEWKLDCWRAWFDGLRASWDHLTPARHADIWNQIARTFPVQQKYRADQVIDFLERIFREPYFVGAIRVWELGGWRGELANEVLPYFEADEIALWDNYDICPWAAEHSIWTDPRYECVLIKDQIWNNPFTPTYDVAILSHVIEHFKWHELRQLLDHISTIPWLYFETPHKMEEGSLDWSGSLSTHVIDVHWDVIVDHLLKLGYTIQWIDADPESTGVVRVFRKEAA